MPRSIKEEFISEFKKGTLISILKYVQLDDTLDMIPGNTHDMELRGDRVILYYRGGAILSILESSYKLEGLANEYYIEATGSLNITPSINNIEEYIQKAKHVIDVYVSSERNHLGEKDIQQQIVRENNYSQNAKDTDFYVIDMEYQEKGRFDIVAIRWDSKPNIRKLPKSYLPTITIFEVKQGYKSITGKSGMKSHLNDFNEFLKSDGVNNFKSDMIKVFDQKRKLGLIRDVEKYKSIMEVAEDIEFVFLLVNYKSESTQLNNALKEIEVCNFIYANPMGYGLYARNIVDKSRFFELF